MVRVHFLPSEREILVPEGTTLWQAAVLAGLPIGALCGGELACGLCRVDVLEGEGSLVPAEEAEARTMRALHTAPDERLACKARLAGPGPVTIRATYW